MPKNNTLKSSEPISIIFEEYDGKDRSSSFHNTPLSQSHMVSTFESSFGDIDEGLEDKVEINFTNKSSFEDIDEDFFNPLNQDKQRVNLMEVFNDIEQGINKVFKNKDISYKNPKFTNAFSHSNALERIKPVILSCQSGSASAYEQIKNELEKILLEAVNDFSRPETVPEQVLEAYTTIRVKYPYEFELTREHFESAKKKLNLSEIRWNQALTEHKPYNLDASLCDSTIFPFNENYQNSLVVEYPSDIFDSFS